MELQQASRKKAKIKMALQGPSGSGKTMSAILIAHGLTGNYKKIAVIDTENHSADLYAHLGDYFVLPITAPFSPEKYTEAIKVCEKAGMEVIIIDSISHEWEGIGGILDIHGSMAGNSFTNWAKVTPRHNEFVQTLLQSPCHIIGTIRSKQDYVLVEKQGKQVPEKVGLKGVTKEGLDYEFTIVLELNMKNAANVSKDRTGLFTGKPEFIPSSDTGKAILQWCNTPQSDTLPVHHTLLQKIQSALTVEELQQLWNHNPDSQETLLSEFTKRRQQILNGHTFINANSTANGTHTC